MGRQLRLHDPPVPDAADLVGADRFDRAHRRRRADGVGPLQRWRDHPAVGHHDRWQRERLGREFLRPARVGVLRDLARHLPRQPVDG